MRTRRRRNRGTWFPVLSTYPNEAEPIAPLTTILELGTDDNEINVTGVLPLTFDYPQEPASADRTVETLSELIGSEYLFKRLVGKAFIGHNTVPGLNERPAVLVGLGFFVARAADDASLFGATLPIGANDNIDEDYGPLHPNTIREPWMWRRTWLLGGNPEGANPQFATLPAGTWGYGSVMDGPHVDIKVKRRVRQDERLWVALQARRWPLTTVPDNSPSQVQMCLDYRIFGELRKARNTSSF